MIGNFFKKKQIVTNSAIETDPDFLPYALHYDHDTILTKNGELLKTIKIVGFNFESIDSELMDLRDVIRNCIATSIKSRDFAIWLHTIRRKKDIALDGKTFPDDASKLIHEKWNDLNKWKEQYVNELYITVIVSGKDFSIFNLGSMLQSFSFSAVKKHYAQLFKKSHKQLNKVVDDIYQELSDYGAQLLGCEERNGVLYSQLMRFIGKIVNLKEEEYPLELRDISEVVMENNKIAFGNQLIEVISEDGKYKNFATMINIKEYSEVSVSALDQLLQLPQEFIITQLIDFVDKKGAIDNIEYQDYILKVSGDDQLRYISGIEDIMEKAENGDCATDFAEQQITIMLIAPTIDRIKEDVVRALNKTQSLGLIAIREDVFSEDCFWSQLPANFGFIARSKFVSSSKIAGLASLQNFPAGHSDKNRWGDAVSLFRTVIGTPYFFNFHSQDNGHAMIVGPEGSGKTVLLNFLVSQTRKFNNKLFYFGYRGQSEVFIRSISGNVYQYSADPKVENALRLNPLLLKNNKKNHQFLSLWFRYLVNYGKNDVSRQEITLIPGVVKKIMDNNVKRLYEACEFFNDDKTKNIYKKLQVWVKDGKFSFLFDNQKEIDLTLKAVNSINLTDILDKKAILIPVITYLLHKIEDIISQSDDSAVLVLDEAWRLIDNYAFAPKMTNFLKRMHQHNCIVIFATESVDDVAETEITKNISEQIATQIFLPNQKATDYYKTVFGLNEEEFNILFIMDNFKRHFLLKNDEDTIIASLDLNDLPQLVKILSANPRTREVCYKMIRENGDDPRQWVEKFLEAA